MTADPNSLFRLPVFVALSVLLAGPAGAVPVPCSAEVRATPRTDEVHDDFIDKVFAVEIESKESCAKVYIDLVTTERLFDGEEITTTTRSWRKVTADSAFRATYRIARDTTLLKAEFKVARCVVCGTE